jgi:hypothetical protein
MIKFQLLKKISLLTLFFFIWSSFTANVNFAKESGNDNLRRAKELYRQGDYDGAIHLLDVFIEKNEGESEKKKKVAEAYYLKAKIYYDVNSKKYDKKYEEEIDRCLKQAFTIYPPLEIKEADLDFLKRVEKIKGEIQADRKKEPSETKEIEEPKVGDKSKVIAKPKKVKNKKKFPWLLVVGGLVVVGVVVFLLLKSNKKKEYTLTVTVGEGAQGDPTNGATKYKEGTTVNYNYSLQSGYKDLQVRLDGEVVSPTGTIIMNRDHILAITAAPLNNFTLTVEKGQGVEGIPDSGVTTHEEGTVVHYSYTLRESYKNLVVKLDGTMVNSSGEISMNENHTLETTATALTEDSPPTVRISSHSNGETVSGGVDIKAETSDDKGVNKVEFYIDGELEKSDGEAPYRYYWNTSDYSEGPHSIKVIAYDTVNQTGEDRITLNVEHTKPKYNLDVAVGEGVEGSPETGRYSYDEGTEVAYSYSLKSGYANLVVKLDGQEVGSSGGITMNRDHSLEASCSTQQEGQITSATIKFRVSFAGCNLKVNYFVKVDGVTMIDETYPFDIPPGEEYLTFHETFYFTRGLGTMEVKQIADSNYTSYYSGQNCVWSTYYNLSITDYTYTGGTDPGTPQLSENEFYLNVCPWVSSDPAWKQTQTKNITINAPSAAKHLVKPMLSPEKQKECSNCKD